MVDRAEFESERHGLQDDIEVPHPKHLSADDAPAKAPAPRSVPQPQTRQHGYPVAAQAEADAKDAADTASKEASKAANTASKEVNKAANTASQEADKAAQKADKGVEQAKSTAKEYGKAAERKFEAGREEAKKEYDALSERARNSYNKLSREAQDDWHKLSKESKKQWEAAKNSEFGQEVQKPEVWGTMLGVANLAVVGGLAYFTYANWGRARWDRRVVTGTVIAASAWFGLQGYVDLLAIRWVLPDADRSFTDVDRYILPQTDAVQQRRR